jgi:dihydrofolate reductase
VHFVHSIPAALGKAYAEYPGKTIFFIGGAKLYNSVCNMVEKLIITQVPGTWEADTYFDSNDDSVIKGTFVHTDVEDKVLVENYKDGKPIKVKVFQQLSSAAKSQRYGDAEPPRPKLTTLKWMRYRPKTE